MQDQIFETSFKEQTPQGISPYKKITKKKKKTQQTKKQIKRQRQRNRRANHKQYVLQLQTKIQEQQTEIFQLRERVQQLENQLQTNNNVENQQVQVFCKHCRKNVSGYNYQQIHSDSQDRDPQFFFRQDNFEFKIGTRSQCILLVTVLCLIAGTIAQDPNSTSILPQFSLSSQQCASSFFAFISLKNQVMLQTMQQNILMYKGSQSCNTLELYEDIQKVSQMEWFQIIFMDRIAESMSRITTQLKQISSFSMLQIVSKVGAYFNTVPSDKTIFFGNLLKLLYNRY